MGRKRVFTNTEIKEMINDYENGLSLKVLEKKFYTYKEKIKDILKENSVELREYNKNFKYVEPGTRFYKLVFIKEIEERKNKKILWLVQCDCGNEKVVYKPDVLSGKTKSCGCLPNRTIKTDRYSVMTKIIYSEYRKSARVRNYNFNISLEEFTEIINSNSCYYCGSNNKKQRKDESTDFVMSYMGIDRLFNNIGYENDNVVPCCTTCNYMKKDMDVNVFLNLIETIYKNRVLL